MIKNSNQDVMMLGSVLFASLGLDQTTKRIAEQSLDSDVHSFLFDTFRLQFIKNAGAFLGFGSTFSPTIKFILFLMLPIIILTGATIYVVTSKNLSKLQGILITLMISGGFGNLVDRILLDGLVTDFLNVGIGGLRTGIFNIADVAITFGAIGLMILEVIKTKRSDALDGR